MPSTPIVKTVLASSLPYPAFVSQAVYKKDRVEDIAQKWINSQKNLPKGLSAAHLVASLQSVYVPYWVSSIRASAEWKGRYAEKIIQRHSGSHSCERCGGTGRLQVVERLRYSWGDTEIDRGQTRCKACDGSGTIYIDEQSKTRWHKIGGANHIQLSNIAIRSANSALLEFPETKAEVRIIRVTPDQAKKLPLVPLKNLTPKKIQRLMLKRASEKVHAEAEQAARLRAMGHVTSTEVRKFSGVKIEGKAPFLWLCPMYIGLATHRGRTWKVHLNAVSGEIVVRKMPTSFERALSILYGYLIYPMFAYIFFPSVMAAVTFSILSAIF